jgi:hypothetical protein
MRRIGIVVLAVFALFTISAVSGAETKLANAKKAAAPAPDRVVFASTVQADSPLVRAAKISFQARQHPKSRMIIDSTTLVVSRWREPSTPSAATGPDAQGRSWASGNSADSGVIASRERNDRQMRAAAEQARQEGLRQEQGYMAAQSQEPYSEVIDDHVTKRLETIPTEMTQKPPM